MWNSKVLTIFLMVAVVYSTVSCEVIEDRYEEEITYRQKPWCAPSTLDTGIECSDVEDPIDIQGGLYSNWELHYVPLASAYYVARFADAQGYQDCCPANKTFLQQLNIQTPWSGTHGAIAIDGSCGYDRDILRRCAFPTDEYPFLCTGSEGNPGTYGRRLETLSYISVLQGSNLRWTLFIHCWRAKTPDNPRSQEIATSFNVFNLDPELPHGDRKRIIAELKRRGFDTSPSNLIEFDYTCTDPCTCNTRY